MTEQDLALIKQLHQQPKVVAVGECGLDFNRNFSPPNDQLAVFERQLELACELNKPLFLHERDASDKMIEILQFHTDRPKAVYSLLCRLSACLRALFRA